MTRILFPCIQPVDRSPGQRYRFEQYAPYLHAQGFEIEYAPALRDRDLEIFYGSSTRAKAVMALQAIARRAWSVRPRSRSRRADVVFVQREAFFLFGAWSEYLAGLQAPMVFDFDDAIWMPSISEANQRLAFLKNLDKTRTLVERSAVVLAGNEYLAAWARQHSDAVQVVPTCVDTETYRPPDTRADGPVQIGWCGSPGTVSHLRPILPVLERVKQRYGSKVRIRVMGDPSFRSAGLGLVGERWSSEAELAFLRSTDIGMMPLPDEEWCKGKCGLKGLTSMSCGAATIMSPVGVNREIIESGSNGYFASTEDEWFDVLCALVADSDLRRRIAANGRRTIQERYSISRWREPFVQALRRAMDDAS